MAEGIGIVGIGLGMMAAMMAGMYLPEIRRQRKLAAGIAACQLLHNLKAF